MRPDEDAGTGEADDSDGGSDGIEELGDDGALIPVDLVFS